MRVRWRHFPLIAAVILASLLLLELGREVNLYDRYSEQLESAHAKLVPGMKKEQVCELLCDPENVRRSDSEEYWSWSARNHQGWLFQKLGLVTVKGHYELVVEFNQQNEVAQIWGGVN